MTKQKICIIKNNEMNNIKLNFGCGPDYREGWINVDLDESIKADERFDLNEKLPYSDNSITEIVASHIVEHLPNVLYFISEVNRILKKGGKVTFKYPHYSSPTAHIAGKHIWSIGFFGLPNVNEENYSSVKRRLNYSKFHKLRSMNWLLNLKPSYTERLGICYLFPIFEVIIEAIK